MSRDEHEAAEGTNGWGLRRRELVKLLGASLALAGAGACKRPRERILPYAARPPDVQPDDARYYATSMVLDGFATGLLVKSREGRPVKIEGNPAHPASLGATGVFEQAWVLGLYDPDRARDVQRRRLPASWSAFDRAFGAGAPRPGLWFVLHPQSSPSIAALIAAIRSRHPGARFVFHTPLARAAVYEASQRFYDEPLEPQLAFDRAWRVLSFDEDFLAAGPMALRWARDFSRLRRPSSPRDALNRLYVAETTPSPTGSLADHALPASGREIGALAAGVLAELLGRGGAGVDAPELARRAARLAPAQHESWIRAVARDLGAHAGRSLVLADASQPVETHILVRALNELLQNVGQTVRYTRPALMQPLGGPTLADLVAAIEAREVETVVVLEGNPVYTAPAKLELARWLARVPKSAHLSLYRNETSEACEWFVPALHGLESWGDARAYDGTISLIQPLVRPLFAGRTPTEILAAFSGAPQASSHQLLRDHWRASERIRPEVLDTWLGQGLVPESAAEQVNAPPRWEALDAALRALEARGASDAGLELRLSASPKLYDGRFANNGWLQELPHPLTKLTWDNAALISPRRAASLSIETGDVLRLRLRGRELDAPALVVPGQADGVVTLALGYGRRGGEGLARGIGVDGYKLRVEDDLFAAGLTLEKTGERHQLAVTQEHFRLHGRTIAPQMTLQRYRAHPHVGHGADEALPSLLPALLPEVEPRDPHPDTPREEQWAMSIDTTICSGCSACVVACQAENNIPLVGRSGVLKSREMHWLRIDRYLSGPPENPRPVNQPMLCQHCEKAPCEYVCPVNATVHSPDGLNEMVYNRCVGTRFCSNNCPYKVRRFNWFEYNDALGLAAMQRNPEVTVRERGVMEKCTYCVQRIRGSELEARLERRELRPGEVVTACQQACPTQAIAFGSLRWRGEAVVRWREEPRAYAALHELGTRPRTRYLAKVINPNPELT